MADVLDYSTLFARLKVLIHYFNVLEERQTSTLYTNLPFPYIKNQILLPYESQDATRELQTLESDFLNTITLLNSLKLSILLWFEAALTSQNIALGVHSNLALTILLALSAAMTRDSETINARELIVNASDVEATNIIVPWGSNTGSGRLAYTFLRTGLSVSEIANDEVLQCQCINAATVKHEVFQLSGAPKNSRESYLGQGSGLGPAVAALGNSITNGDFEDWTSSAADNWTATIGAWDTEIVQEASVLYEGVYAVKTAYAEGDWKITHPLPTALLPDTTYIMAIAARKVTAATGTLRFGVSDGDAVDDFVAGCVSSIDVAALTTSYALQYLIFKTPAAVSITWTLGISSDTPGVADFYFDLAQFGAMTSFNNMNFAIVSGATGFGLGDKFGYGSDNVGFKIDESAPGIIQEFIGRCFNTQLPSATSAGETIVDPGTPILTVFEFDRLTISDTLFAPYQTKYEIDVSDDLTTADDITQPLTLYEIHVTDDLSVVTSYTEYYALYEVHSTDDLTITDTLFAPSVPVLLINVSDDLTVETNETQLLPPWTVSITDDLTIVDTLVDPNLTLYELTLTDDLTVATSTAETVA